MIRQVIFQPNAVTGADGWVETGAPLLNPPQPPNRSLPAPIFDVGIQYQPNNGATGNWLISKTVVSNLAGPGLLTIPPGTFPGSGGVFADDQTVAIRVNGVAIPFIGLGTGNLPPQSQPVTWLFGSNTVDLEVRNTVAGGTAVTGQLIAAGPGVPCDCCPTGPPRCANGAPVFPCRRGNGTVEWYDADGNLVSTASVVSCATPTPFMVTQLQMNEAALGDDNTLPGERICDVVPPVSSFTGYTAVAGPCYDGSSANTDTLTWTGPLSSVSMSYQSGGNPLAGAALVSFQSPSTGVITWPANGTPMVPGEVRQSDPIPGGRYATITYLAPAGTAGGGPRQDGGAAIRIGPPFSTAFTPYHFRIDFWEAL